jgi:hypothetical protein
MDFTNNPYTTVLIPEPMDYFASCAATSMCEAKCGAEFRAFDHELAYEEAMHTMSPVSKTIERTTESMLFVDLNEDAYTPMNILAMVELSDCRPICGGASEPSSSSSNADTCIAVAGLPSNNTISVKKYCVPRAQGKGVRSAPTETWFVWFSEEWSDTLVDLQFLDTIAGDALVALRDNKGRSPKTGPPEQFVSVHDRVIQKNPSTYDMMFSTPELRSSRQLLVGMSSEIEGINGETQDVLAITDMQVIPTGKSDRRQPWVLLNMVVSAKDGSSSSSSSSSMEDDADASYSSITDSFRVDVCVTFDTLRFAASLGRLEHRAHVCKLNSLFDIVRSAGYTVVVLDRTESPVHQADLLMVPGESGYDACVLQLRFSSLYRIAPEQTKSCFETPDSFITGGNFPLRKTWTDMQREMFLGMDRVRTAAGMASTALTQEGQVVLARRVVSQNSLSSVNLAADSSAAVAGKIQMFSTGDPGASTHWLKQVRIGIYGDLDGSGRRSVSSKSMHSTPVQTTVVTYHSCDRKSCLGCASLKLQALCYAAHQCSVVQCIGTVVNQNRPLCNAGLVLKSYADGTLSMILGAWLIFTDSYTMILDAALLGPPKDIDIEWVDDAFFGYVCTAKVIFYVYSKVQSVAW